MQLFSFLKKDKPSEFEAAARDLYDELCEAYKARLLDEPSSTLSRLAKRPTPAYSRIAGLQGFERGHMAVVLIQTVLSSRGGITMNDPFYRQYARADLCRLACQLVTADKTLSIQDFDGLADQWFSLYWGESTDAAIVKIAERMGTEFGPTAEMYAVLSKIKKGIVKDRRYTLSVTERKLLARIDVLIDPSQVGKLPLTDPWQAAFSDPEWEPLLRYAMTASAAEMSGKWATGAKSMLASSDAARFLDQLELALGVLSKMDTAVDAIHSDMLRGLAWFASLESSDRAAAILGRMLIVCARKVPGVGSKSIKGFSGAAGGLEKMGTFPALAELSKARNKVKQFGLSNTLTTILSRAAQRQNMPLVDLEEIVVPTFGLELPGVRTEVLGSVEAGLEIESSDSAVLRWFKGGKEVKSPPAEVKSEHGDTLKELKQVLKEIESALPAQKARIEGMLLSGRTLPYPLWRERYIDHPLLAHMTRRLIWRFTTDEREVLGIPLDGVPTDVEGQPIDDLHENSLVRLWHPIHAGLSAIEAWREFLISHEIRQPFKQAHREIYILTEAELRTGTYSNRFAAHILKQHQMSALAKGRGWQYQLQGYFDNANNPTLQLPRWGMSVEFFVATAEIGPAHGESYAESGIAFYVSTDQVRFLESGLPIPLEQVPPVVLSETMRDVDLFVGVASVGNDPSWLDQGERNVYNGYWQQVSFGDLSVSAETRRAVLERLLPRLAIGKVSHIKGRFLVVKGKLRTYKIHLGSGNILMEPNDQYLCIVPGFSKAGAQPNFYLPFEGDGVFAIILSKALMLAEDDKIKDPTITRQIHM